MLISISFNVRKRKNFDFFFGICVYGFVKVVFIVIYKLLCLFVFVFFLLVKIRFNIIFIFYLMIDMKVIWFVDYIFFLIFKIKMGFYISFYCLVVWCFCIFLKVKVV